MFDVILIFLFFSIDKQKPAVIGLLDKRKNILAELKCLSFGIRVLAFPFVLSPIR
jgi:hypothetical protein